MIGGIMGKLLIVDLATGEISTIILPDELWLDCIGGYGLGARLLWDWQPGGADPLGPLNTLGIVTGILTGTPLPTATRYTVVGKSPLTHTWGDANASGFFGVRLKMAGVDGVFFKGISTSPVYLVVEDGQGRLLDASDLWGKDTYDTEEELKKRHGKTSESVGIGPAGEKLSLISGVTGARGRIAARSGLGAVMGSKRVKAVVAVGDQAVQLADPDTCKTLRAKYTKQARQPGGTGEWVWKTGTPGSIVSCAEIGDSPFRNWAGTPDDFPDVEKIGYEAMISRATKKRRACFRCPLACWGDLTGIWQGQSLTTSVPEYETASAFGSDLLMSDLSALVKCNDICNRAGLDTISTGATIAFALECYERGILSKEDTGGLELRWGDPQVVVALTEQIARREGLGDILADGTRVAAQKIGKGAEGLAMHIAGQELSMHDPRVEPVLGVIYVADATPGRHTQANQFYPPPGLNVGVENYGAKREQQEGRARLLKPLVCLVHVVNAAGYCLFGFGAMQAEATQEWLTAVTGHVYNLERVLECGERIANIRQAFNIREGYNLVTSPIPGRAYGLPPAQAGPHRNFTVELGGMLPQYLQTMDWSLDRAIPSRAKLQSLGLSELASAIHGPALV